MDAKLLRKIAAGSGLNEKAVDRLLGSIRITVALPKAGAAGAEKVYDLGLRLGAKGSKELKQLVTSEQLLMNVLKEYRMACPVVAGWIGRGDFDPSNLPERIKPAVVLHACRTAGRIRAKVLRSNSC